MQGLSADKDDKLHPVLTPKRPLLPFLIHPWFFLLSDTDTLQPVGGTNASNLFCFLQKLYWMHLVTLAHKIVW